MMNTVASSGSSSFPVLTGWVLHWVFGTLWIVGAVLLIVWAVKYLKSGGLKSLAWWLFGIGVAGAILTAPFAVAGGRGLFSGSLRSGSMMGNGMIAVDSGMMGRMMNMMVRYADNATPQEREDLGQMGDLWEQMMGDSELGRGFGDMMRGNGVQ